MVNVDVARGMLELVSEISERLETTTMIAEHKIKGVLDIVNRDYVLDKGRIVFTGTLNAVRSSDILTHMFLNKSGAS